MARTSALLADLKQGYAALLGANLVGIYLHGSYVMGCYNPAVSDLDYIVVVKQPLSVATKKKMMMITLEQLWPLAPAKGLEFHVLLADDLSTFNEPVPFDFHFSKMHYQAYLADSERYIARMQGTDPDLTAHLMILNKFGQVLIGRPIREVFATVPTAAYFNSILFDIGTADQTIATDPMYTILNLCRALAFRQAGLVTSKLTGAQWALHELPAQWHLLIEEALTEYQATTPATTNYSRADLKGFADYLLAKIKK